MTSTLRQTLDLLKAALCKDQPQKASYVATSDDLKIHANKDLSACISIKLTLLEEIIEAAERCEQLEKERQELVEWLKDYSTVDRSNIPGMPMERLLKDAGMREAFSILFDKLKERQ